MVAAWTSSPRNLSSVKRRRREDLPVPESPISNSLNVGRVAFPDEAPKAVLMVSEQAAAPRSVTGPSWAMDEADFERLKDTPFGFGLATKKHIPQCITLLFIMHHVTPC